MAYGNQFKSDELGGLTFGATYTDEQYPLGTRVMQQSDELPAVTIEGTTVGNSGVSATTNFALLDGDRQWMFIKASSEIKPGDVVVRGAGTPFTGSPVITNAAVKPLLLGVADNTIAANSYGWVITKGCAVVRSDASGGGKAIAANALIDTDGVAGPGEVNTAAGTDLSVIGLTLEAADATLADFVQCYIDIS